MSAADALREAAEEVEEGNEEGKVEVGLKAVAQEVLKSQDAEAGLKAAAKDVLGDDGMDAEPTSTTQALTAAAAQVIKGTGNDDEDDDNYEDEDFVNEPETRTTKLMQAVAEVDKEEAQNSKTLVDVVREADANEIGMSEEEEEDDEDDDDVAQEEQDILPALDSDTCRLILRLAYHGKTSKAKNTLSEKEKEDAVEKYSVNGHDKHGWTALHWAVSRGHVEFCRWLLERGAFVNRAEDTNGWTALHVAAVTLQIDIAEILLDNGASKRISDNWGDIPHECVCRPLKGKQGDDARELRRLLRPTHKKKRSTKKSPALSTNDENALANVNE